MSSQNEDLLRKLASFICHALKFIKYLTVVIYMLLLFICILLMLLLPNMLYLFCAMGLRPFYAIKFSFIHSFIHSYTLPRVQKVFDQIKLSGYKEWYKGRFSQHINNNFCFKIADSVSTGHNIIWNWHLIIVCTLMMRPIGREHLLSQHLESHTMECWIIWWLGCRSFHTHSGAVFSHPIFFSDQIFYCSNIIIIISGKPGYKNSLYLYYIQNINPEIEIFDLYVAYKKWI